MGIVPRYLWAALALLAGACVPAQPPLASMPVGAAAIGAPGGAEARTCRSASVTIAFDFDGAPVMRCSITGERAFTLLITPEHAPPINPSPWYAFRYESAGDAPVTVTLHYLEGVHRYAPKWSSDTSISELPVELSEDGKSATMRLPPGKGQVSAQELITAANHSADLRRWGAALGTGPFTLGLSLDGRPVEAIRMGSVDAPRLVVLLGRQHPPEVTGAIAMRAFVDELAATLARDPQAYTGHQFLIVPQINPDGVAHGHWRANRGATDLNRDWGDFTQPETRAVKAWLDDLPASVRPVAMIDFHSTGRNLFYVQGDDEANAAQQRFRAAWLAGRENALPGYPFSIEPRNANPGSGTAKNWFHAAYDIPSYTYEVADTADRAAIRNSAQQFAASLPIALATLMD